MRLLFDDRLQSRPTTESLDKIWLKLGDWIGYYIELKKDNYRNF